VSWPPRTLKGRQGRKLGLLSICSGRRRARVEHDTLDKCMQTLSAPVRLDDVNGVDFMEAAVGDLLEAAGSDSEVRIGALDHLAHAVRHQGWNAGFAEIILFYIALQRVRLVGE
jgi:hypothetical protein